MKRHGGAVDRNRTGAACLEGRSSTVKLQRLIMHGVLGAHSMLPVFPGCQKQKGGGQLRFRVSPVELPIGLEPMT